MNSIQKQIQTSSLNSLALIRKLNPTLLVQSIVGVQPMGAPTLTGAGLFFAPYIPKSMHKSKYNFSRAKWHEAKFNEKDYGAVRIWCAEQFGPRPKNLDVWSRWYIPGWTTVRFRDEQDYMWFVLRWSR